MIVRGVKRRGRAKALAAAAGAVLLVALACEAPSPTALRPTGGNDAAGQLAALKDTVSIGSVVAGQVGDQPMVFVDGLLVPGKPSDIVGNLDQETIQRIEVTKGEAARKMLGEAAAGGVIQITTTKGMDSLRAVKERALVESARAANREQARISEITVEGKVAPRDPSTMTRIRQLTGSGDDGIRVDIDGVTLTATNFVTADRSGRLWVTVTTRQWPISKAMVPKGPNQPADGYLFVVDEAGARIVADGFAFANEVRLNEDETEAYVVETFGRRITRFKVGPKASLSHREVFTEFGHGVFADGAAFDAEGCLWVASIISNRILRVAPDGSQSLVVEDCNNDHVDRIEKLIATGAVARDDMQRSPTNVLKNVASITFAGPDLRTVYLGSLGGDRLGVLRSPVAGLPPVHWKYRARI